MDVKQQDDKERVDAPAGSERGALAGWVRLFACLAVLWVFVFQIAPRLQQVGVVRVLHDYVRENDIDAAAIYYTDIVEFSDADSYMRDAMTY